MSTIIVLPLLFLFSLPIGWTFDNTLEDDPIKDYFSYGPLTSDFQKWLIVKNLAHFDFIRDDYGKNGSFGGKSFPNERVERIPVIFLHGNSDSALYTNEFSSGWDYSIQEFMKEGYSLKELYGISWGNTVQMEAIQRYHSCSEVRRLRTFLKAVLEYTGSPKVSIVSHSMGTTLMRKAIQGGYLEGPDGGCKLGKSLDYRIDAFIGIASANSGLCWCAGAGASHPTCNRMNGFYVSPQCDGQPSSECSRHRCEAQKSDLLTAMTQKDAHRVYSIWSSKDELIGGGGWVWGTQTCLVPHSDGQKIFNDLSHMQTKERSSRVQFEMVAGQY